MAPHPARGRGPDRTFRIPLLEGTALLRAVVDEHDRIVAISQGLLDLVGMRREEATGAPLRLLLSDDSAADAMATLAAHRGDERPFSLEASLRRPRAAPAPFIATALPGVEVGYLEEARDVASGLMLSLQELEESRVFREALQARRDAEQSNAKKARLLGQISHEVRTPMNIIMGYIQLARFGDVGETEASHLDTALSAAETLMSQMSDMLDLSRIESGRLTLSVAPFDLVETLTKIADQVRPRAEALGLGFSVELDPALPRRSLGDQGRIGQILHNYLSNALKFTEAGEVHLRARALAADDDGWRVRIEVEDTGCGITEEDQRALFSAFSRGDQAEHGSVEGWGLGLSICKAIAGVLRADVGVRSVPGQGALFHVEVDLRRERSTPRLDALPERPAPLRLDMPPAAPRRVLLAEDNRRNRQMLSEALSRMGHAVSTVGNGEEAVEACREEEFDLVLMDVRMPRMRGDAAAAEIRAEGRNRTTPIVAVTANSVDDGGESYAAELFDQVMMKPLDLGSVRLLLESLGGRDRLIPDAPG